MSLDLKNTILGNEINKIRKDIPKLADLTDDQLFNLVCFKYFYNDGDFSIADYRRIYTDGINDGGIDFITIYEPDNQTPSLVFAQSKLYENAPGKRDIPLIYKKMDKTIRAFKINKNCDDYNDRLVRIIANNLDEVKDTDYVEELVVFIYSDISEQLEKSIKQEIEEAKDLSEDLKDYQITLISKKMIDNQITIVNEGRKTVKQGEIKLFREDRENFQIIKYGENGLFTTISARDLQRLYRSYREDGLFEQNLRYYRPNKKIDDKIKNSIFKNKKNFWYFNNGIIIACSDFKPDGDNIKLWSFSIINGGQTTVLIGDYFEGTEDFAVPCKIIRNDDYHFLAQVAEASNSQKAISDADLKANAPEQIQLKKKLEEKEIYLDIKRGKIGAKNKIDKECPRNYDSKTWNRISNQELGQLMLSFIFQEPGTARSNKNSIFAVQNTYKKLFLNKEVQDLDLIKSLVKLYEYLVEYEKNPRIELDQEENEVLSYGKLYILAVIGFFIKIEKKLVDYKLLLNNESDDIWETELSKNVPHGSIFAEYIEDDFENILRNLFLEIIGLIKDAHQSDAEVVNSTYTNFLKTNPKYRKYILKRIMSQILRNDIKYKRFKEDYLKIFNI